MWLLLQPQVRRSDALGAAALVGVGALSVLVAYLKVRGYR
jgi:hypothetical protein